MVKIKNYNNKLPIPLSTIPDCEKEKALKDFSEDSEGLHECLRVMWDKGLETMACCSGDKIDHNTGYIKMAKGVDLFSYLSQELLNCQIVSLELRESGFECIRIAGPTLIKELLFYKIASDIRSGHKNNHTVVQKKINIPIDLRWRDSMQDHISLLRQVGTSKDIIDYRTLGLMISKQVTLENFGVLNCLMDKYYVGMNALNAALRNRALSVKRRRMFQK